MTDSQIEFDVRCLNRKLLKKNAWSADKLEIYLNSKMGRKIHQNQIQLGNTGHFKESIKNIDCRQARKDFNVSMVPQNN